MNIEDLSVGLAILLEQAEEQAQTNDNEDLADFISRLEELQELPLFLN